MVVENECRTAPTRQYDTVRILLTARLPPTVKCAWLESNQHLLSRNESTARRDQPLFASRTDYKNRQTCHNKPAGTVFARMVSTLVRRARKGETL